MAEAPAGHHRLGDLPYVLIQVTSGAPGGRLTLRVNAGGGIDTMAKVVATVLALVEQVTGASCDEYAEQAAQSLRERGKEVRPQ